VSANLHDAVVQHKLRPLWTSFTLLLSLPRVYLKLEKAGFSRGAFLGSGIKLCYRIVYHDTKYRQSKVLLGVQLLILDQANVRREAV